MSVHHQKRLFLIVFADNIKLAGNKQNLGPMWKYANTEVDLGKPTSFLDHVHLEGTQGQCDLSKDIVDSCRTMFESKIFHKSIGKTTKRGNIRDFHVVLRHGRSCPKVCGTLLWCGEQKQLSSCTKYPLLVLKRIEIRGRIVGRMLSDCPEMLVFGTHW